MAEVQPIPEHYPRVTPYLCVDGAAEDVSPEEMRRRSEELYGS